MKHVILFTKQNEKSLIQLRDSGEFFNREIYVRLHMGMDADYFIDRYRTYVAMAEKIVPRPSDKIEFPVWCAIEQEATMVPDKGEVVYILKVPADQVIYMDGLKWDHVLNYIYIPKDEADEQAHKKELSKYGLNHDFQVFSKYKGYYPELEEKIADSWVRVFDIDKWSGIRIQANLWGIKEEWVVQVVHSHQSFMGLDLTGLYEADDVISNWDNFQSRQEN